MSYIANSPETVYRYALRLDGAERALTDGFGFSIVLVNDDSPVCAELVLKYFAQLSHRTANRVRFIFFGEMTSAESQERRMSGQFLLGWLQRVIAGAPAPAGWGELRPEALQLVRKPQQTLAGWVERSAVPDNAGAAIRFAQRLAVAKYVPCLVMFTDIGDLNVHLLPIARLTVEQLFERICYWVDQFYEDNRSALARWDDVEKEIAGLCADAKSRLERLRKWRESTVAQADEMREIAGAMVELERLRVAPQASWGAGFDEVLRRVRTRGARTQLDGVNRAIQAFTAFHDIEQRALRAGEALRQAETKQAIVAALLQLSGTHALAPDEEEKVRRVAHALDAPAAPVLDPEKERQLWISVAPSKPSADQYGSCTEQWRLRHPDRRTDGEHYFLMEQLKSLSVAVEPEEGARVVLERQAEYCSPAEPRQFLDLSPSLQELIRAYLQRLLASAPGWFKASAEVSIGQAMRTDRENMREAAERRRQEQAGEARAEDERILAGARAARDQALAALDAAIPLYESHLEDGDAMLDRLIRPLRDRREVIERELYESLRNEVSAGRPARGIQPERLQQLTELLDEYDRVVASLTYPYVNDELVITVELPGALHEAMNLPSSANVRASHGTRSKLSLATTADEDAGSSFDVGVGEAEALTPAGALNGALAAIVASTRLDQLLSGTSDPREVLLRLSANELALLGDRLQIHGSDTVVDRPEIVRRILGAIGADPSENVGAASAYDFDVFLSYHSPQKTDVEGIAQALAELGLKPWLDTWHIAPGAEFKRQIRSAFKRCRAWALFVGPEGTGSWQEREIVAACEAAKQGVPVVPVLLGAGSRSEMLPVPLQRYSCVQIANAKDRAGIEKLTRGLMRAVASV